MQFTIKKLNLELMYLVLGFLIVAFDSVGNGQHTDFIPINGK